MEILKFIFRDFWTWAGFFVLMNVILYYTVNGGIRICNRFWRHWNIRKHGYPPEHCDADGDFKESK